MIKTINIKNFKSVVDLKLELGRFNVFIGENGCGKSNILEAIAFGAASNADKLDYEFLGNRGLRVVETEFMFSAFENGKTDKSIDIDFIDDKDNIYPVNLSSIGSPTSWINNNRIDIYEIIENVQKSIKNNNTENNINVNDSEKIKHIKSDILALINEYKRIKDKSFNSIWAFNDVFLKLINNPYIAEFIIYSPEQSFLRDFRASNQKLPFSFKGEGLFQELKKISLDKNKSKQLKEIKELLSILDWFEDFKIPDNLYSNEYNLSIKDKYLNEKHNYFDQRSTNEGFLFLLFYFTLFVSTDSPPFFAIENIETALNPKLCIKLIHILSNLAEKKGKQVIITTHNPSSLNGLNLNNDNERLFVVYRNNEGHTKVERILSKPTGTGIKLSELWTSGIIGGLPDNF